MDFKDPRPQIAAAADRQSQGAMLRPPWQITSIPVSTGLKRENPLGSK